MKRTTLVLLILVLNGCVAPRTVKIAYYPQQDVKLEVEVTPLTKQQRNEVELEMYQMR